jgi:small subunit ribosomal protein S1
VQSVDHELMEKLENPGEAAESWEDLFEAALDAYDYAVPVRGQIVQGRIIDVNEDSILVDVGAKQDAIVPRKDLDRLDEALRTSLSPGDPIAVYVMRTAKMGGQLLVSINRGLEQEDWKRAAELLESGEVLSLPITGQNKGGVLVQFGRLRGFVPNSHVPDLRKDAGDLLKEQKDRLLGQEISVKVLEVDQARGRLVLSGRAARRERRLALLSQLPVGENVTGRVVNLVRFGAFVDLGGVDGLIHISELDWRRVEQPSEVLELGDEVEVKILKVDVERERISLSRRALLPNPWQDLATKYAAGDLVPGVVSHVRDFGAFVMLEEGIEGLVHTSEMDLAEAASPDELPQPGDKVVARVLTIEPDRERISLSLAQVDQDAVPASPPLEPSPEPEEALPPAEPVVEDFDAALEAEADQMPPEA